ncbi:MAG TPA: phage holin family protein [Chitinophagaceae bacterium]
MQNAFLKVEELVDHMKEFVNNRVSAVKLQTAEKTSKIFSNIVAVTVVAAIMLLFAIMLSMGASYFLSGWIGVDYAGFLMVGGFWLLVGLVIWLTREKLLRMPIMNKMLHEMFHDEADS